MATRAVSTVITYRAWDTSANAPKTGDSANHTLKWIKDGTSSTTTNAGAEVDATNAKGTYKVTLTSTETDCTFGTLAGVSSTANIALFGVEIGFEYVPTAATTFGAFIGNATAAIAADASGRVDVSKIAGTAQTARDLGASVLLSSGTGTGQVKLSAGYIAPNWGDVGNPTTVNNLSGTTVKTLTDAPSDSAGVTTLLARVSAARAGYFDNLSAGAVMLASSYTAPDNTSVTAIKAKTDSLTFSQAGQVDANIKRVADTTVTGSGTSGSPWGP